MSVRTLLGAVIAFLVAACGSSGGSQSDPSEVGPSGGDGASDAAAATSDAAPSMVPDAGADAHASTDASSGGPSDASTADGPMKGSKDASADAPQDGSTDPSSDAGIDASAPPDAALEAGTPLDDLETLFQEYFTPTTDPSSFSDPGDAAYLCLAATSGIRLAQRGAAFDPTFVAGLQATAQAAADSLVASAPSWGGSGWGLTYAWDAFGDGTVNPATTVYAFETGLAAWCLAEAANVLGDASYRSLAVAAVHAYNASGYVGYGDGYSVDCTSCGYYWYSLDSNDTGRYVKNTNIEMGMASLVLDYDGSEPGALAKGTAAAASQYSEIASYKNYGYLGVYDPDWTAPSPPYDDHNSFEIYLLFHAGQLLGNASYESAALDQYAAYSPSGSADYVAYAACHLARVSPAAESTCTAWIEANGADNPAGMGLVMEYP